MHRVWWVLLGILGICVSPSISRGVVPYQIDTFEDGTTENWTNGSGGGSGAIDNIPDGGPAGLGDNYLRLSSGSFGGSIRSITFNNMQWQGDYTAAGVLQIAMDLKNLGSSAIPMRVAIREDSMSGTLGYASTTAYTVPADGDWHAAVFTLDESSMTAIGTSTPFADVIADVAELRILSSAAPSMIGDAISAQIGLDNIMAIPGIPEPSVLSFAGLALLTLRKPRRRV